MLPHIRMCMLCVCIFDESFHSLLALLLYFPPRQSLIAHNENENKFLYFIHYMTKYYWEHQTATHFLEVSSSRPMKTFLLLRHMYVSNPVITSFTCTVLLRHWVVKWHAAYFQLVCTVLAWWTRPIYRPIAPTTAEYLVW